MKDMFISLAMIAAMVALMFAVLSFNGSYMAFNDYIVPGAGAFLAFAIILDRWRSRKRKPPAS